MGALHSCMSFPVNSTVQNKMISSPFSVLLSLWLWLPSSIAWGIKKSLGFEENTWKAVIANTIHFLFFNWVFISFTFPMLSQKSPTCSPAHHPLPLLGPGTVFWCLFDSLHVVVDYFSYHSVKWVQKIFIPTQFIKGVYEACFSDITLWINIRGKFISLVCCQLTCNKLTCNKYAFSSPNMLLCDTVPRSTRCHQTFGLEHNKISVLEWCVKNLYMHWEQTFSFCCCYLLFFFIHYMLFLS